MDGSYDAKLREIKARQQNWMRERESSMEREKLQKERENPVPAEELVDALTARLAQKIEAEIRLEDRTDEDKRRAKRREGKEKHQQLEGYLAKEIASHTCPICYELMVVHFEFLVLLD